MQRSGLGSERPAEDIIDDVEDKVELDEDCNIIINDDDIGDSQGEMHSSGMES